MFNDNLMYVANGISFVIDICNKRVGMVRNHITKPTNRYINIIEVFKTGTIHPN